MSFNRIEYASTPPMENVISYGLQKRKREDDGFDYSGQAKRYAPTVVIYANIHIQIDGLAQQQLTLIQQEAARLDKLLTLKKRSPLWFESMEETQQAMNALKIVHQPSTVTNRISALKCLFKKHEGENLFWITVIPNKNRKEEVYLKVVFSKGPYESEGIREEDVPASEKHYHINAYESVGPSEIAGERVMHMRIAENNGELVWLSKGEKLSGKQALHIASLFREYCETPTYLYDDATKYVDGKKLLLKSFAIGDPNGLTWYQKLIPNLALAPGVWRLLDDTKINQDEYAEALSYVRNCRIKDIWAFFQKGSENKQFRSLVIETFADDFAQSKLSKPKYIKQCSKTVEALTADCLLAAKNAATPEESVAATNRECLLREVVLEPSDESDLAAFYRRLEKESDVLHAAKKYWNSIRIISDSRIFIW